MEIQQSRVPVGLLQPLSHVLERKTGSRIFDIIVLGGTHGDERGALEGLEMARKRGIQTYMVNPQAVMNGVRYMIEDINRATSKGYEHDRYGELESKINVSASNPYLFDLHNCNGNAKLGIVSSNLEIHREMALNLGLDILIIFENELGAGTLVEKLNVITGGTGMIIEVGRDIDDHGETSKEIAKKIAQIKQIIQSGNISSGGQRIKSSIPVLKVSILRDVGGKPILDVNEIQMNSWIPDYCILGRGGRFWVVTNEDGTYPEETFIKSTIEQL